MSAPPSASPFTLNDGLEDALAGLAIGAAAPATTHDVVTPGAKTDSAIEAEFANSTAGAEGTGEHASVVISPAPKSPRPVLAIDTSVALEDDSEAEYVDAEDCSGEGEVKTREEEAGANKVTHTSHGPGETAVASGAGKDALDTGAPIATTASPDVVTGGASPFPCAGYVLAPDAGPFALMPCPRPAERPRRLAAHCAAAPAFASCAMPRYCPAHWCGGCKRASRGVARSTTTVVGYTVPAGDVPKLPSHAATVPLGPDAVSTSAAATAEAKTESTQDVPVPATTAHTVVGHVDGTAVRADGDAVTSMEGNDATVTSA